MSQTTAAPILRSNGKREQQLGWPRSGDGGGAPELGRLLLVMSECCATWLCFSLIQTKRASPVPVNTADVKRAWT
uniref:Uncharacterized protein n=1 Tax=Globodera rostochiensis TaxID=31243 RepID=A0A914I1B4_GLORO